MKTIAITCPGCGFPPPSNAQFVEGIINSCSHCGTTFTTQLADQIIQTTIHTRDEARIELAKIEREKWEHQREQNEKYAADYAKRIQDAEKEKVDNERIDNGLGTVAAVVVVVLILSAAGNASGLSGVVPVLLVLAFIVSIFQIGYGATKAGIPLLATVIVGTGILFLMGGPETTTGGGYWWFPTKVHTSANWIAIISSVLGGSAAGVAAYAIVNDTPSKS